MRTFEWRISNSTSKSVAFYLEPWGGKYTVPCGGTLRIVIEAPGSPVLEWKHADDVHEVIVRGPAGALATVYDGTKEVRAE